MTKYAIVISTMIDAEPVRAEIFATTGQNVERRSALDEMTTFGVLRSTDEDLHELRMMAPASAAR